MKIKPKKSLGQNFLKDKNIIKKIIDVVKISEKDNIIEIGPGYGILTEYIVKKKPKKIILVEKDNNLANFLHEKFNKKVIIENKDILNFKIKNNLKQKFTIFGNLPYNISTEILIDWITNNEKFESINKLIFMFQKEVADRIIAKKDSKSYGRISIISNWKLDIKKEFDINANSFFPKPKINSTLLSFAPKKNYFDIKNPNNLEKITQIFFNKRRKMIKNPIKQIFKDPELSAKKLGLDTNLRPQNLSPLNYFEITKEYENQLIN